MERKQSAPGCEHYQLRCQLFAPCCQAFFWCRHCHNQAKYSQEADIRKRHVLNRHSVRELLCTLCDTRQPVSSNCCHCGVRFAAYSCTRCALFDDDTSKRQFHCEKCGICRVGGRENFFHCDTCGCCYSNNLQGQHPCVARNLNQPCSVCSEYLFDSTRQISVLVCGHTLHRDCQALLIDAGFQPCPVCARTASDVSLLRDLVQEAESEFPMPAPEDAPAAVFCSDCLSESVGAYHVLGQQCKHCASYNTRHVGC